MPQKENQKIEQQRLQSEQEKVKAADQKREEEDRKVSLKACLVDAEAAYHNNWNSECKSQGLLSASCIELTSMTFDEYVEENKIPDDKSLAAVSEFYEKRDDCSCRLSFDNIDRLEEWRKESKDECYRNYGD